jgi:glucose-6-phosphate isomerase
MPTADSKRIALDWTKAHDVIPLERQLNDTMPQIIAAKRSLCAGSGKGSDFMGWVHWVEDHAPKLLTDVKTLSERIASHSDALVVVGIGGSLLGTKAVYEALTHSFAIANPTQFQRRPVLFWAGHHVATDELNELLDVLDQFSPSLLVVSKSGTTTEPALAFRVLKQYLDDRFGAREASARIFAITDPESGTLLKLSQTHGYPTLSIPRNIGGRYSIFTAVGLLPLAVAGINVNEFLEGARQARLDAVGEKNEAPESNPALCYAAIRNALYKEGYKIEALCHWTPKLRAVGEWWKQLFGESDGKGNTGLFPASAQFTTDLHSMGQYFQEGERHLFATHLRILDESSLSRGAQKRKIRIPQAGLADGFDYLTGQNLEQVQHEAIFGTSLAHADGGVPTLIWDIPELSPFWLGYWLYMNMFACGVGGLARGVNPFDQPGVEAYKTNMFALLGKPDLAEQTVQIRARLERGQRLRSLGLTQKR